MAYFEYRPTSDLYHYASVVTFRGIIATKQLWLSDISSSNDPRELKLGYDWLLPMLEKYNKGLLASPRKDFFDFIASKVAPYIHSTSFYCSCMSLARDSLPMWATYGDKYEGVALGLRPTAIDGIPGRLQKVRYIGEDTKKEFENILLEIADRVIRLGLPPDGMEFAIEAISAVVSVITSVKHHTWDYEREVRILIAQQRLSPMERGDMRLDFCSEMPDGKIIPWQRPLMRISNNVTVPYIPFSFGKYRRGTWNPTGAISEVILGPKCKIEEGEMKALLQTEGFTNFRISKSACLIR